jgi:hypothetical protein
MKVAVWDTYVTKKEGGLMHFDILAPDNVRELSVIHEYGKQYLASKGQQDQPLTTAECRFCHIEQATGDVVADIGAKGYHIIEMQGC